MGVADYYYLAGSDYAIIGPAAGIRPQAPAAMSKKIVDSVHYMHYISK